MLMIEPAAAVRFPVCAGDQYAPRFLRSSSFHIPWSRCWRSNCAAFTRREKHGKYRYRSSAEHSGSGSDPAGPNMKLQYHPFEAIGESPLLEDQDARLTPTETSRTIIEVNSQATLMFSSIDMGEDPESLFWPGLPYVTDEHGNIYFRVNHDEDLMQSLASGDNLVQVVIGLNATELSSSSGIDISIDEIEDEEYEDSEEERSEDDNDDEDWDAILETDDDGEDSYENAGDWAKLDTMQSCHPMFFARKLAKVADGVPVDWMSLPPAGLIIQGLLRPSLMEEHTNICVPVAGHSSKHDEKIAEEKIKNVSMINGDGHKFGLPEDDSGNDEIIRSGTSFYKLEMINVELISSHGHRTVINTEDLRKARPDAVTHSAAKIMSRLKAGGENTLHALKSLCWRCKGIQVQEAMIIGIDALGFDLRACSGTQVQTLRFAFSTRATSEYSAERQLNELLFPRIHRMASKGEMNTRKEMLT